MNPLRLARRMVAQGRAAEPAPQRPEPLEQGRVFGGSVQVRHVDAGSCNGCEIEVAGAFGPVYDAERYGARLVASPRHADVVLVTGVVGEAGRELLAVQEPVAVLADVDDELRRSPEALVLLGRGLTRVGGEGGDVDQAGHLRVDPASVMTVRRRPASRPSRRR